MVKREYPQDLFEKYDKTNQNVERITRPSIKYWADVRRRLKENKLAMFGLYVIVILGILSIVAPYFNSFSYSDQNLDMTNNRPSSTYWFGTDQLGRDLFTRVFIGARYSLLIGILAALVDLVMGIIYGGIAGMASGRVDSIMMRIAEIIYAIPYMLIVIILSVALGQEQGSSLFTLILAMSITGWVPMAIMVRGQVLQLKENEYVLASKTMGAGNAYILRRHIIPNTMGPILVRMTITIPGAIFSEATLSFLGLGLQPPVPSLGSLANDGLAVMNIGLMYQLLIPSLLITLIMFSFNVLGDGLRDALDPRLRK